MNAVFHRQATFVMNVFFNPNTRCNYCLNKALSQTKADIKDSRSVVDANFEWCVQWR